MSAASAQVFDSLATEKQWLEFTAEEMEKVRRFLHRWDIRAGERVLEPGCGSGRLTLLLANRVGPTGQVLAFDSSVALMEVAARRNPPSQVVLRVGSAATLPLAAGYFDHVVCFNVFPHLVPQVPIARRLAESLRPKGVFWIAHTGSRQFINSVHRRAGPAIRNHLLAAPLELKHLLAEVGLEDFEIEDGPDRFLARAVRAGAIG